jgi:hypothetical protein
MRIVAGSIAACVVLVAGCASDRSTGYEMGPAFDGRIASIAVPVFGNQTFSHGLEFELTEAVIKEVRRTAGWRVTSGESADATLTGTITRSDLRPLSIARSTGLVQEQAVEITVDFDLVDNRTGEPIVSRRGFRVTENFAPARPVQERLEVGQRAAITELARDLVGELRTSW